MRHQQALVFAALAVVVAACGASGSPASGGPGPPSAPSPSDADLSCPAVAAGDEGRMSAIDYVDFIQAFGRQYIAGLGKRPATAHRADLGEVLLRSRCSFAAFNDRTHLDPGEARDGDTGFLPAGTPIYALKGWSRDCRIAAEEDGRLRVFLAYRSDTDSATPRDCALRAAG